VRDERGRASKERIGEERAGRGDAAYISFPRPFLRRVSVITFEFYAAEERKEGGPLTERTIEGVRIRAAVRNMRATHNISCWRVRVL